MRRIRRITNCSPTQEVEKPQALFAARPFSDHLTAQAETARY
jgi:hypothetical protein